MLRKYLLSAVIGWLLWIGFLVLIVRFNKYDWADSPMLDCDTDAESAATLLVWLVWLTTVVLLGWYFASRRTVGKNMETIALAIALLISLGSMFKYIALMKYEETISKQCETESSNTSLSRTLTLAPR